MAEEINAPGIYTTCPLCEGIAQLQQNDDYQEVYHCLNCLSWWQTRISSN